MEPIQSHKPRRNRLLKLALSVFTVLLLLPATRYLLLSHLQMELFPTRDWSDRNRLHETALHRPNDYGLQLADALNPPDDPGKYSSVSKRERLQELAKQFPDRPSVYANMLRFMTMGEAVSRRNEEYLLSGEDLPDTPSRTVKPDVMAIYEDAAIQGERLDPTNAYFPLMRAAGLFAARQDGQAMQEMHRAAQCACWDDYCQDEAIGQQRLSEAAFGQRPAFYRVGEAAAILFPHYSRMRAAAKIAAYKAILTEAAGRPEAGFAIREDILRIGSLIRSQSPWGIGCQVGIGITDIGMTRPGGAPLSKAALYEQFQSPAGLTSSTLQSNEQACSDYFQRTGHADRAAWLTSEIEASRRAREIIEIGTPKSVFNAFNWNNFMFIPIWMVSSLLPLANMALDYTEDALLLTLLGRYPDQLPWVASAAGIATLGKNIFGLLSFLALGGGLLALFFRTRTRPSA